MNQAQLLRKLLPGFIPLFIFIAADEIWGTKVGLIVAIVTGIGELLLIRIREKRFDRFTLFDTLLIIVLGMVSILLENDLFFKLKPGLVELILIVFLGISGFTPLNLVGLMGQKYLKDIQMTEEQIMLMRKNIRILFFVFLVHTILVFYSAFYMSSEAWGFISGGLFYIIFGVILLVQFIKQRLGRFRISKEEWLPIVDESGTITGKAPRSAVHNGRKLLHPVVHMHIIHPEGKILLQKRPLSKLIQPGKWDTAVGGHIAAGETLEVALKRETLEETGLKDFSAKFIKLYKWETDIESELVYLFISVDSPSTGYKSEEADELRFWSKREIDKNLGTGIFTESFEHEFHLLRQIRIV
jgi:isopentenyldiphosphate isomerase/intracellular septation protein A